MKLFKEKKKGNKWKQLLSYENCHEVKKKIKSRRVGEKESYK